LILYSKDTKFLGASADVLSTLGYEDINVFMSYNNDIADLFVNRPGYVHKFDNFSWISYVLNGSLPNKSVIIKTRNGGEIESSIAISEIFLSSDDDKYYIVKLGNIRQVPGSVEKKVVEQSIPDKQPIFKAQDKPVEPTVKIADFTTCDDTSAVADGTAAKTLPQAETTISFKFDEKEIKSPVEPVNIADIAAINESIATTLEKSDVAQQNSTPKAEKPAEPLNIADIAAINESIKTTFETNKSDVVQQNLQQNNTPKVEKVVENSAPKVEKVVEIKIDTLEISDLLGISTADVAKYMREYVSYLDANIDKLQDLYKNGNTPKAKRVVINLIGIGSNLRAKEIVQVLKKLLAVGAGTNNASTLQEIETVVTAFKQSVSKL